MPETNPRWVELRGYMSWLLDNDPPYSVATDQILFVDVSLALDQAFTRPAGYFLK